jgi:hypothetical protein
MGGTEFYLPPGVRTDLAYEFEYHDAKVAASRGYKLTVPDGVYEIPLYVQWHLTTTASAGSRAAVLQRKDPSGIVKWYASVATLVGANASVDYALACGSAAITGPAAQTYVSPFMTTVGKYSDTWVLSDLNNTDASDVWSFLHLRTLRIPTGPPLATPGPIVPTLQLT